MIQIKEKFKHLSAFLVGNPAQFLLASGSFYCVREGCEECPYHNKGCSFVEEKISSAMIPPARRAIGLEEKSFLVLRLLPGKEFRQPSPEETESPNLVPQSLWNNPLDHFSLDERNLHFITANLSKKFRVLKGQFRYYGSREEFQESPYAEYFSVFNEYAPQHHVVAFDFSAVEPRGSAIASREEHWLSIYRGTPKVIVREVELLSENKGKEDYLYPFEGKTFCFLKGELDKEDYSKQCEKCKIACKVLKEYKKNVPGDFHALNAKAFFSGEPNWPKLGEGETPTPAQKEILDKYRGIAKICGLAAVYGAKAWTLAHNMKCSELEAQKRLDNFFATLTAARQHMLFTEQKIIKTGISTNFFGRVWDVSKHLHSQSPIEKERKGSFGYAIRIGYNHPIQSSMAEVLKISMIRVDEQIEAENWSPLYGPVVPRTCTSLSYLDFICTMLLSIHDEEDFLVRSKDFDTVLPSVYKTLQVTDVIKSLGVDFLLEMDVEYDLSRSFTATTKYPPAKTHLLNTILPRLKECKTPNMFLVQEDAFSEKILKDIPQEQGTILLGVQTKEGIFVCPQKVAPDFLIKQGIVGKKVFFSEE